MQDFLVAETFFDEVKHALLECSSAVFGITMAGDQDDRDGQLTPRHFGLQFQAAQAWHSQVSDDTTV